MNVLIVGGGAIGCLVGGKLAQAGQSVTIAGRPRLAEAARNRGIVLTDERGRHEIASVRVAPSVADAWAASTTGYDAVFMAVKSYATAEALAELSGAMRAAGSATPTVISLQNGVGNEEAIAATFGGEATVAGVLTTPVSVTGPGEIVVEKPSYSVGLAAWEPGAPQAALHAVRDALRQAGFAPRIYPDARGMKWTKLLMNMVGNATSAILDMPPGKVFADTALVDIEIEAWREALAVMAAAGIRAVNMGSYPFALLAPLIRALPKGWLRPILRARAGSARGNKMPSLHIDLHAGRLQSEVEWLNGAVVREGKRLNIPTPVNSALTHTLMNLLGNKARCTEWRGNVAKLLKVIATQRAAVSNP